MKLNQTNINKIIEQIRQDLKKYKLSKDHRNQFTSAIRSVMETYLKNLTEDTEINHQVSKKSGRYQVKFSLPGKKLDPFIVGEKAKNLEITKKILSLFHKPVFDIHYSYLKDINHVLFSLNITPEDLHFLFNPMVISAFLGLLCGFLCQFLPPEVASSLSEDFASPLLKLQLSVLTGIMGPIIFLTLLSSIDSLDSIKQLNMAGGKLIKRFTLISAFVTAVTIMISLFVYPVLGENSIKGVDLNKLMGLFLDILPTNIFSPFLDNNFPQIVILGIVLGAALLIIKEQIPTLPPLINGIKDWALEVMNLFEKTFPLLPFLSIFTIVSQNELHVFIKGWKYLATTYLCMLLFIMIKLIKVSVKCKLNPLYLIKKLSPLAARVFTIGTELSAITLYGEIAKNVFKVDPDYNDFYFPISRALLSPSDSIGLIIAAFMVAEATHTPFSLMSLVILFFLTVQLSLASPGFIPGVTILFQSVGLSATYIGMFTAYSVFIKNVAVAFTTLYHILDEGEAASTMKHIMTSKGTASS